MTRLKYERIRRGLSQEAVGVLAGRLSQSDIGLIEAGQRIPTPKVLARLAAVFDLPADVLLKPIRIVEEERT